MNKPKQVAEADILALIGSLTNVAYTEATHEGIEYEVYEADRVDVPSLRSLPCVQDATLREKSVIISLRPAYRDSLTSYDLSMGSSGTHRHHHSCRLRGRVDRPASHLLMCAPLRRTWRL